MLHTFLGRIGAYVAAVLFWTWTIFNAVIDWIGHSTVVEDFQQLIERLPGWLQLLYSAPWWMPGILAAILTLFLIWLSWPKEKTGGRAALQERSRPL